MKKKVETKKLVLDKLNITKLSNAGMIKGGILLQEPDTSVDTKCETDTKTAIGPTTTRTQRPTQCNCPLIL